MGTLNISRIQYAQDSNRNVPSTIVSQSTAFTTSGSAANVTGITLKAGDVIMADAATSHWLRFGGDTAAVGTGIHLVPNLPLFLEVDKGHAGLPVSVIEG